MVTTDLVRAAALVGLVVMILTGTVTIATLAVIGVIVVIGQIFHDTSVQGVIPAIAGRDSATLDRANGRIYGAETAGKALIGPPLGSWLYVVRAPLPFIADAVTFIMSALLLLRLPTMPPPKAGPRQPLMRSIKEGMVWLARQRRLRTHALLASAGNIAHNMAAATLVLYATDQAGLGIAASAYGVLLAALAAGGVVGGPLTARISRTLSASGAVWTLAALHAVAWPLIAVTGNIVAAVFALAFVGMAQTVTTAINVGLRQQLAPPELLNRVTSGFRWVVNAPTPIAALIGGILASQWGLAAPMWIAGLVMVIATAAATPILLRRRRDG
jgi:predicted MFS family arabinose efflux permease